MKKEKTSQIKSGKRLLVTDMKGNYWYVTKALGESFQGWGFLKQWGLVWPYPPPNMGFLGGSVVKNLPANAEEAGSVPGLERAPGEGNGTPLQYFCLGYPMDGGVR